jgi:hypothetical protein
MITPVATHIPASGRRSTTVSTMVAVTSGSSQTGLCLTTKTTSAPPRRPR